MIPEICESGGRSNASNGDTVVLIHTNVGLGYTVSRANVIALGIKSVRNHAPRNVYAMRAAARSVPAVD